MSFNDYIYWQTLQETGKTPEEIYEYEHPEVVRCKECRWAEPTNDGWNSVTCNFHGETTLTMPTDGFCSYGEREGE